MSQSWGSWGHNGQWENQWWQAKDWQADSDGWQATNWETAGSSGNGRTSRALRRMSTDDGKEYCNRTYLGGEERTSLTREDRLKLVWSAIYTLEPQVEWMWKPQWIQRADLQLATGTQLDALIYLISRFQPGTNLRTFKDLRPDAVREGVRASYVSRQPEQEDRARLLEQISQHRDHLDVLVRWAEYNYFQPGADPKALTMTSIKARAPRGQDAQSSANKLGWLYLLPAELVWGEVSATSVNQTPAPSQPLATPQRTLGRRSTDEDPPKRTTWHNVKVTVVYSKVPSGHCATTLGQELASVEKRARIARARAEEEEQNLLAERKKADVLQAQVHNAQLMCRPAPWLLQEALTSKAWPSLQACTLGPTARTRA